MAAKKKAASKGKSVHIEVDADTLRHFVRAADALSEIAAAVRSEIGELAEEAKPGRAKPRKKG